MISASGFRKGTKIVYKDDPYEIVDFQHSLRARGRGKIWTRMKNLKKGNILEETFNSDVQFPLADMESRSMQYLYDDCDFYTFMDLETYEQHRFLKGAIGDAKWFLKEGETYMMTFFEGTPLSIELSASFVLKVVETDPAVRGDTATKVTKRAVLETGLEVKVPAFIAEGEIIKVDTRSLEYISRA